MMTRRTMVDASPQDKHNWGCFTVAMAGGEKLIKKRGMIYIYIYI